MPTLDRIALFPVKSLDGVEVRAVSAGGEHARWAGSGHGG